MQMSMYCTIFFIFVTYFNCIETAQYRIVNGKNANIEDFPYQLSLRRQTIHICGAAILNGQWAITAAHCVHGIEHIPSYITLRMGSRWRSREGVILTVKQIHSHPSYNPDNMNFDVSLMRVRENAFDRYDLPVRSIKLPQLSTKIEDNVAATVSGWGYQSSGDHLLSSELKYAIVYTVNQQKCHESLYSHGGITNAMFCAAARNTDACQGDSGGPITINGILVGVVSWGVGCADPYYPGVYTRLAYAPIRFWIKLLTKL
ncbi:trypsin beta-like [Lucilia sericata]|uniref:trypsin beta-like n=1 Tax=Lucilia sericata TaxID=13632 RepID=UPI0018A881A0|nr:trypsin beta-like [Lucilia sericata]